MATDSTPERHDWPEDNQPVVFMYPPEEYEVVKPDRFREWEQRLTDLTGLGVGGEAAYADSDGYLPTLSWCGPNETHACDSDVLHA